MEDNKKLLTFLVVIAIILSAASLYWTYTINKKINPGTAAITNNNNNNQNQAGQKVQVSVADAPYEGSANAPITILEFSDFQCPYCGKFVSDSYPQIKSQYIDTGKAKLFFRNFPLPFHENAEKSAEASLCANEQGKFWAFHDKLFANQTSLSIDNLKQYAKDLVLDASKFNSCLDAGTTANQVTKDTSDGTSYGIGGTPSFFIFKGSLSIDPTYIISQSQANQFIINLDNNATMVIGAQPVNVFSQAIEKLLKE